MNLEKTIDIEEKIKDLLKKAYEIRTSQLDKSISLTNEALSLSRDLANNIWYARSLSLLALFQTIKGEFASARQLSLEALDLFADAHDLKGIADAKYNIASVHYKTDNYHEGLRYLLDCLQTYRQLTDHHNEARVLKSMGTIYEYFGDLNNAISSYESSITAGRFAMDLNLESNAYNPLSGIYLKQGKVDLAKKLIDRSVALKKQTGDIRGMGFALYGRGKVFLKQGKLEDAKVDFLESLQIHTDTGDKLGVGMASYKLGLVYKELGDFDVAHRYLDSALEIGKAYNISFVCFKTYYTLYQLAKAQHQTEKSLAYLEEYIHLKESVINYSTYNVIKSYEAIAKIEALENEARIQKEKSDIVEIKNIELDSFFYRVSHDLKGPISSLMGLHNLAKTDVTDEVARNYFDMYQSQLNRINNIVMELINLTRMSHMEENKQKIDFSHLVKDCISSYHYLPDFKKIKFTEEIDAELEYYSEWSIINTILQNLIENAIKYQRSEEPEPSIRVVILKDQDSGSVQISVEDNGQGITHEHQKKIFDMFYRGTESSQGTGLGLYILKRAVERLKGEVSLHSEPGLGSIFTVVLPLK